MPDSNDSVDTALLVRSRARVKASLTLIDKFSHAINSSTSIVEIDLRLSKIQALLAEFAKYDDVLGDFVGYLHEFEEFEERLTEIEVRLMTEKCNRMPQNSATIVSASDEQSVTSDNGAGAHLTVELMQALKLLTDSQRATVSDSANSKSSMEQLLPKLQIKRFSGAYKEWPTFKDQFGKIHEDSRLSGIQKFTYLRSLLEPEPLLLIENLLLTTENYDSAWKKLEKRYANNRKIAASYIEALFSQNNVREGNADEIRTMSDNIENILTGLDAVDEAKSRDVWLLHILVNKLDENTKRLWAEKSTETYQRDKDDGKQFPTVSDFLKFLDDRRITLESIQQKPYKKVSGPPGNQQTTRAKCNVSNTNCQSCPNCAASHPLFKCTKFVEWTVQQRRQFVARKALCFNCFADDHRVAECPSERKCYVCNEKHHSTVHVDRDIGNKASNSGMQAKVAGTAKRTAPHQSYNCQSCPPDASNATGNQANAVVLTLAANQNSDVQQANQGTVRRNVSNTGISLLPTAQVIAVNPQGDNKVSCNTLLDSGSQISFITESLAQALRLKRRRAHISVSGISTSGSVSTKGVVTLKLRSRYNNSEIEINAYILNTISGRLPAEVIDISRWNQLDSLQLADDQFNCPKHIDLLLGADYFFKILQPGVKLIVGYPSFQNTIFGWVGAGSWESNQLKAKTFSVQVTEDSELDALLKRFWEVEQVPDQEAVDKSMSETFCEKHFTSTSQIDAQGKFVVELPFIENSPPLGNSLHSATSRLLAIEKRLTGDPELYHE